MAAKARDPGRLLICSLSYCLCSDEVWVSGHPFANLRSTGQSLHSALERRHRAQGLSLSHCSQILAVVHSLQLLAEIITEMITPEKDERHTLSFCLRQRAQAWCARRGRFRDCSMTAGAIAQSGHKKNPCESLNALEVPAFVCWRYQSLPHGTAGSWLDGFQVRARLLTRSREQLKRLGVFVEYDRCVCGTLQVCVEHYRGWGDYPSQQGHIRYSSDKYIHPQKLS